MNPPGLRLYARDKYCTSISKATYYWPQVDLLAQSGLLSRHFQVGLIDAVAQRLTSGRCLRRIQAERYDAVIFLTCGASWDEDFRFARLLKQKLGRLTIVSGGVLMFKGREALEHFPFLDAVMLDFTSEDCLRFLRGQLDQVENFIYRDQGRLVEKERRWQPTFAYPPPRHELLPLRRYLFPFSRRNSFTAALTSFGCTHQCTFCVPGKLGLKVREVGNVLEELRHIKSLGIEEVLFQDSCFGLDRDHCQELMEAIIEQDLGLVWMCQSRVDVVDEELLLLMKRAGCHTVQFGVESGDEEILRSVAKGITRGDARRAFALCRQHGIQTGGFFIIGLPGDTEETILRTIDFSMELKCDVVGFSLAMPQPGTTLGRSTPGGGWTEEDLFDEVSRPNVQLGALSPERLWQLKNLANRRFYLRPSYLMSRAARLSSLRQVRMHVQALFSILGHAVIDEYLK